MYTIVLIKIKVLNTMSCNDCLQVMNVRHDAELGLDIKIQRNRYSIIAIISISTAGGL